MNHTLIEILQKGHHSLVVARGDDILTYDGRGVSDLHRLVTRKPRTLSGAVVADKAIGKGAAALMAIGGVAEVYATMVSSPALSLLRDRGIKVSYAMEVDHILNHRGDGICPVEQLCKDCATAEECLPLITHFLESVMTKE